MNEGNSEAIVHIGDFPVPLADIQVVEIPTGQDLLMEIKKIERKTYTDKETDKPVAYYNLQIGLVDFPGETIFHPFFTSTRSLSNRHATQSLVVFLDTLGLPRSEDAITGLAGVRFVGQVREDKKRDGEYQLGKVVGPA